MSGRRTGVGQLVQAATSVAMNTYSSAELAVYSVHEDSILAGVRERGHAQTTPEVPPFHERKSGPMASFHMGHVHRLGRQAV